MTKPKFLGSEALGIIFIDKDYSFAYERWYEYFEQTRDLNKCLEKDCYQQGNVVPMKAEDFSEKYAAARELYADLTSVLSDRAIPQYLSMQARVDALEDIEKTSCN